MGYTPLFILVVLLLGACRGAGHPFPCRPRGVRGPRVMLDGVRDSYGNGGRRNGGLSDGDAGAP